MPDHTGVNRIYVVVKDAKGNAATMNVSAEVK
jgi:hypothetical protein